MKKHFILMSMLLTSAAMAQTVARAPVKHLYIPDGFDSNDSVELVVTGTFASPCFARNTVSVKVIEDKIKIEITAIRRNTKAMCPEMLVPYKEVVSVGNLQGGAYEVTVN